MTAPDDPLRDVRCPVCLQRLGAIDLRQTSQVWCLDCRLAITIRPRRTRRPGDPRRAKEGT